MGDRHIGEISARKEMVDLVRHEVAEVQNFVKSGNQFLKITRSFIANSVREGKLTQIKGRTYFKEAMHAILFCGRINIPLINPEEMMEHHEFQLLSEIYPDAFQKYNSHLPKRPPYAVLLGAGDNMSNIFQSSGTSPVFKDATKISVKAPAIVCIGLMLILWLISLHKTV